MNGANYADAIAGIESGGNYGILGPATKSGDRAYGKYQIMGSNIGPWTKEVLGAPMTPEEFKNNPQAQDAVFTAKFNQYVEKYGPEGAARAWFAGPKGMNNPNASDGNMTVAQYAERFRNAMAPPLPTMNVGNAPQPTPQQLPPISGPTINQQQQQLPGGGGSVGAAPNAFQQIQPMQLAQAQRPQINMAPLQQFLQGLPGPLGLPAQFHSLY